MKTALYPRMTPEQADAYLATMTDSDFVTAQGPELSNDEYKSYVDAAHRAAGRPSLTGIGKHSPRTGVRFSESDDARLRTYAQQHGLRKSEVIRQAVLQMLDAESGLSAA